MTNGRRLILAGAAVLAMAFAPTLAHAQCGGASWYGPGFHGNRAASGEVFNENAMTAAHPNLPFGTQVRVVDQNSGNAVVVRINDRGPFHRGRIIDLSKAAANELGFRNRGITSVCLERI